MDIFLIILSALCLCIGFLGCFLPILPGPPISYVGLLLLHFTDRIQFTVTELLVWFAIMIVAQILDSVVPALGSKYSGGSKQGSWGAFIGSIIGLFFLPWGLIVGPFLGAVIGELLGNQNLLRALKSGIGSLLGFLFGTVLKCIVSLYFIVEFSRHCFRKVKSFLSIYHVILIKNHRLFFR